VVDRDIGDLARTLRLGWARVQSAVRRLIVKQSRQKPCLCIAQAEVDGGQRPGSTREEAAEIKRLKRGER
jgi:hypothetical protein